MIRPKKKSSPRGQRVKDTMSAERFEQLRQLLNSSLPYAVAWLVVFIAVATILLSFDTSDGFFGRIWKPLPEVIAIAAGVCLMSVGTALYTHRFHPRLTSRVSRIATIEGLFLLLLAITRLISLDERQIYLATGTSIACAVVLTIVYDQRFALGLSSFFCIMACFAVGRTATVELFLTMMAGTVTCVFCLREVRGRMTIIKVNSLASVMVFATAAALAVIHGTADKNQILENAGMAAAITFIVGIIAEGFLPLIEKIFGVATSMTLMDYSDANQPLLRKLAMDAPGTFSHSLLIGSLAQAAAEAIDANGLLARVGAYYHDIGKLNKPDYFVENQAGPISRHDQLSPAMSLLVIIGHVKDGIEIAREFGLPMVLRQFIETHHGTTLIEYFYNEARKKADKQNPISDTEFRYPGPKPRSKEAAIVMICDAVEGAVRSNPDPSSTRIENIVHTIAMRRLQDGQFDECDLTMRDLNRIEESIAKSLAAHYHGRIAYPTLPATPNDRLSDSGTTAAMANGVKKA
jgi:cyclic-di-AMP phosphodiesterase PgpH